MAYGGIALIVFWFLIIKMWIQYGPKIPVTFIVIFVLLYVVVRQLPSIGFPFELFVCFLGIAMILVDRVKANPWR